MAISFPTSPSIGQIYALATGEAWEWNGSAWQTLGSNITEALGFTPENVANKATDFTVINNTLYPTVEAVKDYVDTNSGGGSSNLLKHDWVDPYSYCGTAPSGSLETNSVWTITRIEVFPNGTTDIKTATTVAWTDRLIVIYT
jgi:hypothetical protein